MQLHSCWMHYGTAYAGNRENTQSWDQNESKGVKQFRKGRFSDLLAKMAQHRSKQEAKGYVVW